MIDIALYQPDIPQNTGAVLRLGACLGIRSHVIGPIGFDLSDRALRRTGMDYLKLARVVRHTSWNDFESWRVMDKRRVILMTTQATALYTRFHFDHRDILLFGRESAGAPAHVHDAADIRLTIPMMPGLRSLNLAMATAMVAGEALRQTSGFPADGASVQ